ncbi:hypothetical protein AALB53_16135 [Lachnospiraceae bacterium 47-T17]
MIKSDGLIRHAFLSDIRREQLRELVIRQLSNFYGIEERDVFYIETYLDEAIGRTLKCFSHVKNKYYQRNDINAFHSGQYFIFLYYLSNTIYNGEIRGGEKRSMGIFGEERRICDKIYCLNKLFSSCDAYYEVELPDYFFIEHPLASVIGRAKIGNGFSFMQGCTVGGNNGIYPTIGEHVIMFSNSKILGNCHVGSNVLVGANAYIKDMDIPDFVMVFGQYPNIIIKQNCNAFISRIIDAHFNDFTAEEQ